LPFLTEAAEFAVTGLQKQILVEPAIVSRLSVELTVHLTFAAGVVPKSIGDVRRIGGFCS
jgi:hypothetical protein